jgi:membrane protease YdiL (CAAX protease family)
MTSKQKLSRMHNLIWAMIYGGLLVLILGLATQRTDDALGWSMVAVGGLVAAAGFALIYVRSRLTEDAKDA